MEVTKKQIQVKEVEVIIESYHLCDKCNQKIITGDYDAFECYLSHKTGDSYPEGGSGELQEMELCKNCAVDLFSLLLDNGYRVTESEWDW